MTVLRTRDPAAPGRAGRARPRVRPRGGRARCGASPGRGGTMPCAERSPGPRRQRLAGSPGGRRCGAGGTTFPASARARGITTSRPPDVRTVKEEASHSSSLPRMSAVCSLPSGAGRRQRITTRWPASAGVSRTSSRYRTLVTGPGTAAATHANDRGRSPARCMAPRAAAPCRGRWPRACSPWLAPSRLATSSSPAGDGVSPVPATPA